MLGFLLNKRQNGFLLYKQLIRPMMDYGTPPHRVSPPAHTSGGCSCHNPSVFALLQVPSGTLVAGRVTRIWVFYSSPTSET
jgi:hypothetical protein